MTLSYCGCSSTYGAGKQFDHFLSEALHHELKSEGIDVDTVLVGSTSTNNNRAPPSAYTDTPEDVAVSILNKGCT